MSTRSVTIRMLVPEHFCDGDTLDSTIEERVVQALDAACLAEDIEVEVVARDPNEPADQDLAWKERP